MEEIKICPRCKKTYKGYPALSRYDNVTEICSQCGVEEALNDFYNAISKKKEEENEWSK